MKISKADIERILGTHLISYKGRIYRTKEDVHICTTDIEIIDSGISEDDYYDMQQEFIIAMSHKDFN